MSSYKLSYFPIRGLGEVPRQLFALSGTPFEDDRIPQETWPSRKSEASFGQLPILEVDGKQIPQSAAINRYLAKKFGYAGKDDFEAAWVDAIADGFKDYSNESRSYFMVLAGRCEGDKDKLLKEVAEPARDKFITVLEKRLKENKSGFLVGDGVTWADLLLAEHVETIEGMVPGFLDAFPAVLAHRKKVQEIPKLKAWIELRPKTPY